MSRLRPVALSFVVLSILILSTFCFATPPDRITGPIVAAQTIRLAAGVPMQARPKFDQGPVDPSLKLSYITLLTAPSAAQHKALNELLAEQQNPHSASYHKWLTPEQYADQFGLSPNDINKLTAWIKSQGFSIVRTARGKNWIVFSGTAAQVERAFHVQIHNFEVKGEKHFANTTPPSIPAALSGIVTGFRGLNNFRPKSQLRRAQPGYTFPYNGGDYYFIAPGDIATIYDVKSLYNNGIDGTGMTLAVMGQTGVYQEDLTNFRQNFNLSAINCPVDGNGIIEVNVLGQQVNCSSGNFGYILVNGAYDNVYEDPYGEDDLPEADLDLEWSGATAYNAQVIYVTANSGSVWDSWYYAVDNDVAPVFTMSYDVICELHEAYENGGTGEFTFASDEAELAEANSEGITFMNSAGDAGATGCDDGDNYAVGGYSVGYPASSQYVTAVGGTLIPYNELSSTYWSNSNGTAGGSALSYIPEQAWNENLEFAIYCEANQSDPFCSDNGIGTSGLDTDWFNMQYLVIGIEGGGGGVSNCVAVDENDVCQSGFPQPSWQAGLNLSDINPSGSGVTTTPARFTPDVSLLASPDFPGYLVCTQINGASGGGSSCASGISAMLTACFNATGPCTIFGGTSVSTPIFAGMVALLNQDLTPSVPGLGNINPMLYSLAATPTNGAFNPITTASGSYSNTNAVWCDPGTPTSGVPSDPWPAALQCPSSGLNLVGFDTYNYDPTTNYNLAVGLGSPDLNNLATAWVDTLSTEFTLVNTGSTTQTVSAGQTTGPVYSFSVTPVTGQTFAREVIFSCSFSPTDPTLTKSSCTFNPTSIAAGSPASAGANVTLSITTLGPNPDSGVRKQNRKHADNHLPWLPLSLPLAGVVMVGFAGRKLSKYSVVASLFLTLALAGLLIACGSSSSSAPAPPQIAVSVGQGTPASLYPSDQADSWPLQTATFTATVTNDSKNGGVTWSCSGEGDNPCGSFNPTSTASGASTTYTSPTIVSGLTSPITITATSVTDTTKSDSTKETLLPATVPGTYTITVGVTEASSSHDLSPAPQVVVQ